MSLADYGIAGGAVGELVMLVALFVTSVEFGARDFRLIGLIMLHGLLVLIGVDVLLYGGLGLSWGETAVMAVNVLLFGILGASMGPVSAQNFREALSDLISPFLSAAVVTAAALVAGDAPDGELWMRALRYLGLYDYVMAGTLILTMLIVPAPHAPAAQLSLGQRLVSGMGLVWIGLQSVWWWQLYRVLQERGDLIFEGEGVHLGVGVMALAIGVVRTVIEGRRRVTHLGEQEQESASEDGADV